MTRHSVDITRSVLVWRHVKCRLTETRNFQVAGWTKIDIEVVSPRGAPLPIAETSHQLEAAEFEAAGGIDAFVSAWLDREASSKRYAKAEFAWRQASLL